jgi:AraC-like DNA-binding protein
MRGWQTDDPQIFSDRISSAQGAILQRAVEYIEENYRYMSEQSAAEHLGITTSYLSRVFKKYMKTSYAAYVNEVRLREAKALLVDGNDSITDIAIKTGFSNSSYFTCAFRKANGITPGKYRKSVKAKESGDV